MITAEDRAWIELGWRFDPAEARDPHGKWTKGGESYSVPPGDRLVLPSRKGTNPKWPFYAAPTDHPFFKAHPVSAKNIVDSYDASSASERAQGMRWYADAHNLATAIAHGDTAKGAGMLAAYSPQSAWPVNMFNAARAIELNRALGPGDGMITRAMQANAQEALDGVPLDKNFGKNAAPKIRAFAHLIDKGGDAPDDTTGNVVIDRHAMTVAMGTRLTKKEADKAPIGTNRYYQYVADAYREAARIVSARGTPIAPHQIQAITWLHQQNVNAAQDEAGSALHGGKGAGHGRQAMQANAWKRWDAEAREEGFPVNYGTTALAGTIGEQILLSGGWRDAWLHEARNTRGEWTHGGGGLESHAASLERHGYKGRFEGYDPRVPSMEAADQRKALNLPGRPDGAGTPGDPIDVRGDMSRAVQLMADGNHVRLNSPAEIKPLLDEVNAQAAAQGYTRDHEPTWDLGNISVKGTRLFNEQTLGIPRQDMPQLNGPAQPGTEAALLAGGANKFIELDPEFRAQLKRDGIDVKNERVPAGNLRATQTQLTAATVAGITAAAEKNIPAVRRMLKEPIWVTSDNYVLDGHHRWASDEALAFAGLGPGDIEVTRIGLPARLAVPYANAFAQQMGIGGRAIGNSKLVEAASTIGAQLLLAGGWHDAWRHELRGPHGEWISGGERKEQGLGKLLRKAANPFIGAAPHGEEYPGQFSDQIIKYWKDEDNPAAKQELNLAGAEWGSSTASDDERNYVGTVRHLHNAAQLTSDANKAARYNELAANIETHGQNTAELKKLVLTEATPASRIVPALLHSQHNIWNGKVSIYPVTEKPKVLAEMDWDGTLNVQDQVAAALGDARAHPDQPVRNPDAFEVLEHEFIHADVQPGTERANQAAYQDWATSQIEEGFTELGAIHHAPEFLDQMGIGSRQSGTWEGHTVHEMAVAMQDPVEIANGNAWKHYGSQTKDAQDWVQQVAKEEGVPDMRLGTPGHDRVVALTDEINRQGAAGKIQVMARQLAVAMSRNSPVRNNRQAMADLTATIQRSIHDQWNTDAPEGAANAAFASARHTAVQKVQEKEREMMERAA